MNKEETCCDTMRNTQLEFAKLLFCSIFVCWQLCGSLFVCYASDSIQSLFYCGFILDLLSFFLPLCAHDYYVSISSQPLLIQIISFSDVWMAFIKEICLSKSITSIISSMTFYVIFYSAIIHIYFRNQFLWSRIKTR